MEDVPTVDTRTKASTVRGSTPRPADGAGADEEGCLKAKLTRMLFKGPAGALLVPTLLGLSVGVGCAHQAQDQQPSVAQQQQQRVTKLKSRLEEVERINGRLNVRIEELEDQIFLLQDMTESNRIALRRRGYMQKGGYINGTRAQAQAPQPAPESYYGNNPYGAQPQQQQNRAGQQQARQPQRPVTRIPLSRQQSGASAASPQPSNQPNQGQQGTSSADQQPAAQQQQNQTASSASQTSGDDEVVITEKQFREFVGEAPAKKRSKSSSSSSSSNSESKAQPPVTNEKLATGDKESSSSAKPADGRKPLDIYKDALADYRAGSYAKALANFEAFLKAEPKADYVDNALYWIGECHYGLGEYDQATSYFQKVLRDQPDGNKVPDAMLKMSLTYERLGRPGEARALLEKLTDRFPTTNAGRLGAQKLSELQK